MEYTAGNHGQEKEWQARNAWFPADCHVADDLVSTLRHCSNWRGRLCTQDVDRSTATSLVDRLMKWCGCSDGWWNRLLTEWQIPIFVMGCDAAAAFDHVSNHEILKATLAMGVPPVLIAAWIREYRNSETQVKLDDIVTPRIRCTTRRSLCGGLVRAALDTPIL